MSVDTLNTEEQFSSPLFTLTPVEDPISSLIQVSNLIKNIATMQVVDPESFGGLMYAIGDMINDQALALDDEQVALKHKLKKANKPTPTPDTDVTCELSTIQQKLAFLYGSLVKHPDTLEPGEVEGLGATLADIQQDVADIEQKLYPS